MRPRLLITEPSNFSDKALAALRQWADVESTSVTVDRLRSAFEAFDIVWIRLGVRVVADLVRRPVRCRVLAVPATGLDHIDVESCEKAGISVVSLRGESEFLREVRATAELTVGLVLALIRRIPQAHESVLSGKWERDLFQGHELYGKTIGIIGMGRLGRIVAGYFKAFGMDVVGYDPRVSLPLEIARQVATIEDAVSSADYVSVHVNYYEGTRHLISRDVLAAMKQGSILINTSRGQVVDQMALLEALRAGHLAGAAVDVLDGEPEIGEDHPLVAYARGNPRVLITPHIGGNTMESFEKTEVFIAEKIRQVWVERVGT
jgi:D-3-phosphoglycerate dehydrogenase